MTTKKCKNSEIVFFCEKCNFTTSNKYNYEKHLLTPKHFRRQNTTKKMQEKEIYVCECGKSYLHRTSLYNHKKKCSEHKKLLEGEISTDVILNLVKENTEIKNMLIEQFKSIKDKHDEVKTENKELRNQISELIPKIGNNNIVNTTINNKQKFNINIFLNEQCKDAITINEFIDKIKVTLDDMILTKNKGISEGVTNIFIENMNKLSLYERPLHCTDAKRDIVYIKSDKSDSNSKAEWYKDDENIKLKEAIKKITHAQQKYIDTWTKEHPDWENNAKEQEEYIKLVKSCTDDIKEDKIIKKLCSNVYINNQDDN